MGRSRTSAEEIAEEYIAEIWNRRNYSKIADLVSESFVMYDPAAIDSEAAGPRGEVHGRDELEAFVRGVVAGFPDFHVALLDTLSDEDTVMYEGRISMTHVGDFYWIPPTGRAAEFRYMGVVRVEDGEVREHRVYPPVLEVFRQLGLLSPAIVLYLPTLAWAAIQRIGRSYL